MKKTQIRGKVLALVSGFSLLIFVTACSNNNQTKSSGADTSSTSVNSNDTAMGPNATVADTTATTPGASGTAAKKTTRKGRASVGTMTTAKSTSMKPDKTGVYEMTEVRPSFPGGQSALENYITNHIEYPQMAVDDNKEGTVNVQFIVDENGNVSNAKVLGTELGDGLGDEAVRVISKMPKWEPGKVKGKTVKTRLTLPVTYKIEE
jgi:TonB family protein